MGTKNSDDKLPVLIVCSEIKVSYIILELEIKKEPV